MAVLRGQLDGGGLRVAIAYSRYNDTVTRGLLEGARRALAEHGVDEARQTLVEVPGALELPIVVAELAGSGRFSAVVALGAVIEGETDHYAHVSRETIAGCAQAALRSGVPVGCGVLTCRTLAQARDRSTAPAKNKGREAALAALETATLLAALRAPAGGR